MSGLGGRGHPGVLRRSVRVLGALVLAALVAAGCGTRLPDEAFEPEVRTVGQADDEVTSGPTDDELAAAADGGGETTDGASTVGDGADGAASAATDASSARSSGGGDSTDSSGSGASGPNQASDVGVTESTIRLGNITAENGALGDAFAPAVRGLRAWVAHTNANGGIHGREIELFTCDDREERNRSLACARRLVEEDQVFALVATNSRSLGGAAQYLADNEIPVIGFPITNSFNRYPTFFSIYGSLYPRDGEQVGDDGDLVSLSGAYRWFRQRKGVSKAAVFAYDIDESKQAGDFIQKGLELEGYAVTQYVVSFAAPSFDQAVADMQREGTEIVFDAMDDGANRRLCDSMARREYQPKVKVSTVVVMGDAVGTSYNDTCRNVVHVVNESRPYSSGEPEVAEFRRGYARYQPGLPLHQWAMEAWATGNITQDGIESMGPAPTRTGFVEYLDSMEPNTGGGIMVGTAFPRADLSPETARDCFSISRWLDDEGGWVEASSPFPFCYPDAKRYRTPALEQGN